jgi:broad specificity phosphatase PhoE
MRTLPSALVLSMLAWIGRATPTLADGPKSAGPAIVMIIRHAEKPEDKDPNLSPRGFQRADALAHVIPERFPHPDYLFATKRSAHSDRPLETITPLARAMHMEVESNLKDEQFADLAHQILADPKYAAKTVLIAWHHGEIPQLAHALGAKEAPDTWKGDVFDRVWEITYDHGVATWHDLPQHALPGDSEK